GGGEGPPPDRFGQNTRGGGGPGGWGAGDKREKLAGKRGGPGQPRPADRRGRTVARCQVDGEDIQKWLVGNGWALAFTRISRDYEPDEKAAREARAGMWQGAFIAPWDWRVGDKKTAVLGGGKQPQHANAIPPASGSGPP